jgi:hypothetical protein
MTGGQAKLVVAGVFLAGLVTGIAAMRLAELRTEALLLRSPDPLQQVVLSKMNRDLRLSPSQRLEVHAALREARLQVFEATRDAFPRFLAIYDQATGRITASLDERQRARFSPIAEKRRKILVTLLSSGGRRPGSPP